MLSTIVKGLLTRSSSVVRSYATSVEQFCFTEKLRNILSSSNALNYGYLNQFDAKYYEAIRNKEKTLSILIEPFGSKHFELKHWSAIRNIKHDVVKFAGNYYFQVHI